MAELNLVTYCGLYCGLCSSRNKVPRQAAALLETMKKEGAEYWGGEIFPGFAEFWKLLERLTDPEKVCPGCKQGGGPAFCGIRKCARERKISTCPLCDDFPCDKIDMIAKGYVTIIPDGERIRKIGLDTWIQEQEKRSRTGFCYCDIRNEPYEIPRD